MIEPPNDKIEPSAVPKPAQEHGNEDVEVDARRCHPRTPQGDEDVVDEPSVEGHVPVAPELGDVGPEVGPVEVFRDLNSEEPGDRKSTRLNSSHLGISYA